MINEMAAEVLNLRAQDSDANAPHMYTTAHPPSASTRKASPPRRLRSLAAGHTIVKRRVVFYRRELQALPALRAPRPLPVELRRP